MSYEFADLGDLHALGILQEANRLFFHPLGLAMAWNFEDDGRVSIAGLLKTADPEGWCFSDLSTEEVAAKADAVSALRDRFVSERTKLFGGPIQPIGDKREEPT